MSKHNYSQYSNKNRNEERKAPAAVAEVEAATTVSAPAEPVEVKMEYKTPVEHVYVNEAPAETSKETVKTKNISGIVIDCNRLNVREEPNSNAKVVTVLNRDVEVEINKAESTADWFKVAVNGIEGYCMRKFISAKA